jgi:hypothetical protein
MINGDVLILWRRAVICQGAPYFLHKQVSSSESARCIVKLVRCTLQPNKAALIALMMLAFYIQDATSKMLHCQQCRVK